MRRFAAPLLAAVVLGLALAPAAGATPRDPRLAAVRTWAFAIGDGALRGDVAARYAPFDLVVVDGEQVTRRQVAALHARGTIVLAYLSVGTIERGRGWYRRARPYRLEFWGDWGEWYANTARRGYRRLLTRRVAPDILAKGADGLFLDNTDMIESHPRQRRGMRRLVRSLARLAHGRGRLLFSQNGEDSIEPLLPSYDGWNREDVSSTYDFDRHRYVSVPAAEVRGNQAALRRIAAAGLLVTATDYVRAGDSPTAGRAVANACAAGALPYVSDIGLTRLPAQPLRCP